MTFKAVESNASSSSVTSLCFLGRPRQQTNDAVYPRSVDSSAHDKQEEQEDSEADDDSEQEEFEAHFRRSRVGRGAQSSSSLGVIRDRMALDGVYLATCDFQGNALIWDVGKTSVVERVEEQPRGPGLALRRIFGGESGPDSSQILYHTRDPQGTVSLHDTTTSMKTVAAFATESRTFCAATPCQGDGNLIALPCADGTKVMIRDWRSPSPVACFPGAGIPGRKHGMLTSLAMLSEEGGNVVLCGMEDGNLFFHDWTRAGPMDETVPDPRSTISLGSDPILTLDVSPSPVKRDAKLSPPSLVFLAGLAGDAGELSQLDESDRGRIAIAKASFSSVESIWESRIRRRLGTSVMGKPGVAVCRFRPDGRIFAAGGWDKRLRVYHRDGRSLSILKGHEQSIQAIDWSPDANSIGLMASTSSEGRVCVWRCFGEP